jgi:hypothetical protein
MLDWAWFLQIKLPIVNSKPNQAVVDGLLEMLESFDSSEHVSCLEGGLPAVSNKAFGVAVQVISQ